MRRKTKILTTMLVMLLAGVIGAVVAPSPAAASWEGCPDNKFCTYWDAGGNGAVYYYSPAPSCIAIGAPWNTNISSVWNRTPLHPYGYSVRIYKDSTCSNWGLEVFVCEAQQKCGLGWPWTLNDHVGSIWFRPNT